jgi:hypothetical protein
MKSVQVKQEQSKPSAVAKYGSYLIGQFCYQLNCVKSEELCHAEQSECHCGQLKAHTHCKNCGGISLIG